MPRQMRKVFERSELTPGERVIMERLRDMQRSATDTNTRMSFIMATLDDLLANARAMDTRLDSVRALIGDLRAKLDEALSNVNLPKGAQEKIDELFGLMEANAGEVTQALQPPGHVEPPAPEPAPAPEPVAELPVDPAPAVIEPAPEPVTGEKTDKPAD